MINRAKVADEYRHNEKYIIFWISTNPLKSSYIPVVIVMYLFTRLLFFLISQVILLVILLLPVFQ